MPCCRTRPRNVLRPDAAGRALDPSDRILQPHLVAAEVEMAPAPRRVVGGSGARVAAWALHTACCESDGDLDGVVCDRHIRHRCTRDLKQTVKCSTDAHV